MNEKPNLQKALKIVRQESSKILQLGVRINDALWYHVSKGHPNEIAIHLFSMEIGKSFSERKKAFNLYKDGLSELAHRMKTDPKLTNIAQVVGWSKLVYEHPDIVKSLGFEITERDEEKGEALAIRSREDFLKKYVRD